MERYKNFQATGDLVTSFERGTRRLWRKSIGKILEMAGKIFREFSDLKKAPQQLERGQLGMPAQEEVALRNPPTFPQPRISGEPKSLAGRAGSGKETSLRLENVLIVGGMDFFGAALVHQMNAMGFREIVVADELGEDSCRTMAPLKFREFLSPEEFEEMAAGRFRPFSEYSHIFYLGPWKSSRMGRVKSLFEAVEKGGKRFVSLSSAAALGPRQPCSEEARSLPEHFRPLTREGLIAGLFDRHAFSRIPGGTNYLALKSHCLFGPGERVDNGVGGIIKSCHAQLRSTGVVRLSAALRPHAPGGMRRFDFYPVQEAARLAVFLAQNSQAKGVYELGSGESVTVGELVDAVCRAAGAGREVIWDEDCPCAILPAQPEKAWLGGLPKTGWQVPPFDLKEAVRRYVTEYLDTDAFLGDEISENPAPPPLRAAAENSGGLPRKRQTFPAKAGTASKE